MVDDKIGNEKQSTLSAGHFDRHGHGDAPVQYECITWCSMPRATPEATGRCHRATTHYVLPRRPPRRQSTKQQCKIHLLCWPFRWPSRCAGKIPRVLPDGGGLWLSKKPLNTAIGRALTPKLPNRTCRPRLILTFQCEKGLELTCWPLRTIGIWYTKLIRSS